MAGWLAFAHIVMSCTSEITNVHIQRIIRETTTTIIIILNKICNVIYVRCAMRGHDDIHNGFHCVFIHLTTRYTYFDMQTAHYFV